MKRKVVFAGKIIMIFFGHTIFSIPQIIGGPHYEFHDPYPPFIVISILICGVVDDNIHPPYCYKVYVKGGVE